MVRATTSRELQRAVGEFVAVLRTITDGLPDARTAASLQLVQPMAEQVIDDRTPPRHPPPKATLSGEALPKRYMSLLSARGLDYWRRHYGL